MSASEQLLRLKQLVRYGGLPVHQSITTFEDNQACIKLINSDKFDACTKHIDICHHHIRDLLERKIINVKYCLTEHIMLAEPKLTKPPPNDLFMKF